MWNIHTYIYIYIYFYHDRKPCSLWFLYTNIGFWCICIRRINMLYDIMKKLRYCKYICLNIYDICMICVCKYRFLIRVGFTTWISKLNWVFFFWNITWIILMRQKWTIVIMRFSFWLIWLSMTTYEIACFNIYCHFFKIRIDTKSNLSFYQHKISHDGACTNTIQFKHIYI